MFGRIALVLALFGGWVPCGVTPASAAGPTGPSSKAGRTSSFVGGPAKISSGIGGAGKGAAGVVRFTPKPHH
jgi:hypothetical protein